MAEKILNTRIALKYDSWENWSKVDEAGKGANLVLKAGEIGLCAIETVGTAGEKNGAATTAPTVLFKVGDGEHKFSELKWASALAADVHDWAKQSNQAFIQGFLDMKYQDNDQEVSMFDVLDGFFATDSTIAKLIEDNDAKWSKDTTYTFAETADGKGFTITPSEGDAKTITFAYLTQTEIEALGYATKTEVAAVTGDLANLNTEYKDDLVGAINEALQAVEVGGTGSVVTVTKEETPTEGSSATYVVKQGGNAVGAKIEIPTMIDAYTKAEADAEFATPAEVIEAVDKALADVSGTDAITNITTLVEYVNENGADLAAIVNEIYGATTIPAEGNSRIDTAIADSAEAKGDAAAAVEAANGAVTTAGEAKTIAEGAAQTAEQAKTEAATSAANALASAEAAATSANDAADSAEAASTSATTAGEKAEAAAASATTAGEKAEAADASAQAAAGSAEAAAQAKADAEAAKTAATNAQTAAETAKGAAEGAATATAADREIVVNKAADVAANAAAAATSETNAGLAKDAAEDAQEAAETAQTAAEGARDAAIAAKEAAEASNTSATAIANAAAEKADAAKTASDAATEAVSKLHAIATSGNVNDLVQTEGDVLILFCGDANEVI